MVSVAIHDYYMLLKETFSKDALLSAENQNIKILRLNSTDVFSWKINFSEINWWIDLILGCQEIIFSH